MILIYPVACNRCGTGNEITSALLQLSYSLWKKVWTEIVWLCRNPVTLILLLSSAVIGMH